MTDLIIFLFREPSGYNIEKKELQDRFPQIKKFGAIAVIVKLLSF